MFSFWCIGVLCVFVDFLNQDTRFYLNMPPLGLLYGSIGVVYIPTYSRSLKIQNNSPGYIRRLIFVIKIRSTL